MALAAAPCRAPRLQCEREVGSGASARRFAGCCDGRQAGHVFMPQVVAFDPQAVSTAIEHVDGASAGEAVAEGLVRDPDREIGLAITVEVGLHGAVRAR